MKRTRTRKGSFSTVESVVLEIERRERYYKREWDKCNPDGIGAVAYAAQYAAMGALLEVLPPPRKRSKGKG